MGHGIRCSSLSGGRLPAAAPGRATRRWVHRDAKAAREAILAVMLTLAVLGAGPKGIAIAAKGGRTLR
jgi:hypothetical protein